MTEQSWAVWLPARQKWVVVSSEIEARDFAAKFGGTRIEPIPEDA